MTSRAGNDRPWNPQRQRSGNERLLLTRLRAGAASRAQLARDIGLSKPTVSSALASLEQAGLVREAGILHSEVGRSAVLYAPDPTAGYALGIDVGRSRLRVALTDLDGTIVDLADVPNQGYSSAAVSTLVVTTAQQLVATSGIESHKLTHAALGTPGVYDAASRRVRLTQLASSWDCASLVDDIREGLGVQLAIHNAANLAAFGEFTYGAGVGAGSKLFVYVMVDSRPGLGIVSGGSLLTGAHGAAGEIGFLRGPLGSPEMTWGPCRVGPTSPRDMADEAKAEEIFDAAQRGDAAALQAAEHEGRRLAHTVAVVAAVLDPDLVVLGSGVGHSVDLLLRSVRVHLRVLSLLACTVTPGTLGDQAVLHGAVATASDAARDFAFERRTAG
ncbi:ROK family protein [Streptomyces sp. NPDC058548]|uniref:ROK family transcriptional regulator n=1 Tax=unclassified Streptomyces TaxID=2593676 RepID=UPI00366649A1